MKPFLLALAVTLSACASTAKDAAMQRDIKRDYAENDQTSVSVLNINTALSKKKVYFRPSYFMTSTVTKTGSAAAKQCETYASLRSGLVAWLEACEAALSEPDLSAQNRIATLYNTGLIHMRLDDIPNAQQAFDAALAQDSNFAPSYLAKAMIESNNHNYETAIGLAETALEKGLENRYAAYNVIGYAEEGRFEFGKARAAYRQALAIRPGASEARVNLDRINRLWPEKPAGNFKAEI